MPITFTEAPSNQFPKKTIIKACIKKTCESYFKKPGELAYIFVSDEDLLEMNKKYLNHDYFTDIITFDNSESEHIIEGDIFISIERVVENGQVIGNGIEEEYVRVIGHGLLHLCGLKDKTKAESEKMRNAENNFIALYNSINFNKSN